MTMKDTGPMLQDYHNNNEEIKARQKKKTMMSVELLGIMQFNNSTSIPDEFFECGITQSSDYDKRIWEELLNPELIELLPEDKEKMFKIERVTAQDLVNKGRGNETVLSMTTLDMLVLSGQITPSKRKDILDLFWNGANTIQSICKRYGRAALEIFERSRTINEPTLKFKAKD